MQIGHRFETFLMTLFREVQKRSILQDYPLPADLPAWSARGEAAAGERRTTTLRATAPLPSPPCSTRLRFC